MRCVPPSWVLMLLANENTAGWYVVFHCIATSTSTSSSRPAKEAIFSWIGSFWALMCRTYSAIPPS